MGFEHYIRTDGKELRMGFTTGTCAALAAAGAAEGLLTGHIPNRLSLITPRGIEVSVQPAACEVTEKQSTKTAVCEITAMQNAGPAACEVTENRNAEPELREAMCGVVKDAGDDKDATNGLMIVARARFGGFPSEICKEGAKSPFSPDEPECREDYSQGRIKILGGPGIGRVTKPGLDQEVGEAAINRVPREMIRKEVLRVCEEQGYEGALTIVIEVPGGEEAARKTLNEKMGIVGGISIIGTSGIVEPMSMKAYADSVRLQIRQAAALLETEGKAGANVRERGLILTPGNYGLSYLRQQGYDLLDEPVVVCSNFIGDALDEAAASGFTKILLVGHAGKMVKLAAGIMNTHSSMADGRLEIITAHAAMAGADTDTCRRLMESVTTDACIGILRETGLCEKVMDTILQKIQACLDRRCAPALCGMVMFSNEYGELGRTSGAARILGETNRPASEPRKVNQTAGHPDTKKVESDRCALRRNDSCSSDTGG